MRKNSFINVFVSFLIIFSSLAICFAQDKIVAIVNTDIITQRDLDDFVKFIRMQLSAQLKGQELETKVQSMKVDLLNRLIDDRLILQEAKKSKISIDESKIQSRIGEIRSRYPTDLDFQRSLDKQGLTQADLEAKFREQFLTYIFVEAKFRSKIIITPSEVTNFYDKNPESFILSESREVSAVAIKSESLAKEVYNKLKDGHGLEALAQKYSLSMDKMSVTHSGQLRKDIEDAIFDLSLNQASEPLNVEGVFYIFKLDNIVPPRDRTLAEAQDEIYKFLFEQKLHDELSKWLMHTRGNSYIKMLQ